MNLREVIKVTHGLIISGERKNKEVGKICIDSRNFEKGDIFVAIRGNNTSGHKYIKDVIDEASLVITDRFIISKSKTPIIRVFNAKKAIINIGKYNRKKYIDKPLIAITGSVGKTTTTSLIAKIIEAGGYKCFLGGNIGTPLFTQIKDIDNYVISICNKKTA